jgi:hypothetical protein
MDGALVTAGGSLLVTDWEWSAELKERTLVVVILMCVRPFAGWQPPLGLATAELTDGDGRRVEWRCRGSFVGAKRREGGTALEIEFRSQAFHLGQFPDELRQQKSAGRLRLTVRVDEEPL